MVVINKNINKIYIVTSDDFGFAGWVAIRLLQSGFDVTIVNKKQRSSSFKKKFALSLAFGFNVIIYIFRDILARIIARKIVIKIHSVSELYDLYTNETEYALFLMINFDSIIKNKELFLRSNFLNFHPSLLPNFKGLGPIFWCFFECMKFGYRPFGWTVHQIDSGVDEGLYIANAIVDIDLKKSLWQAYISVYMDPNLIHYIKIYCSNLSKLLSSTNLNNYIKVNTNTNTNTNTSNVLLYGAPKLCDSIDFILLKYNQFYHYIKFFVNGGIIGFLSWVLQLIFLNIFKSFFESFTLAHSFSIYTSFVVTLIINFFAQRIFVFNKNGNFFLFFIIGILAITVVNLLSLIIIYLFPIENLTLFAYPLSAVILSPFVFIIKSKIVFRKIFNQ
jgi:hypothetical protein